MNPLERRATLFPASTRHPGTSFEDMSIGHQAPSSYPASASPTGHAPGDLTWLDNPILNSLSTSHSALALVHGRARRFPQQIGPLCGVPDQSPESYADLLPLAQPKGADLSGGSRSMVLFLEEPPAPPSGWTLVRGGLLDQMLLTEPPERSFSLPASEVVRPLSADDAPAMVELARLTEPGPFELRTLELGAFFGIFRESRLVAMAGQRLSLPGFVEVSAVCTHPDARGRGYAPALMSMVMAHIVAQGKVPFLHSYSANAPAIAVYRRLGFTWRRSFHLAVLRPDAG